MNNNQLPLWQLTVGELIDLLKENNVTQVANLEQSFEPQKRYVYGLKGLATLLGCSKVTAQKYKNSGKLNGCFMQIGRKLVFDANLVIEKLKIKKGGHSYE